MDSTAQWPPSPSTRNSHLALLKKRLTNPSISPKNGRLSEEEADQEATEIELKAFNIVSQLSEKEPDGVGVGVSALQMYTRESHTLVVKALKRGPKSKEEPEAVSEPVTAEENTFFSISDLITADKAVELLKPLQEEPEAVSEPVTAEENTFYSISDLITADKAVELLKPLQEPGNKYNRISFSKKSFGLDAARIAAPVLSSLKDQLTEVDISYIVAATPKEEALNVINLFSAALKDSELRYLNLSHNPLFEKGVRAFGELLKSQGNLEELYLINDGISSEAVKAVNELLPSTQKLKVLHFYNDLTGDEGAIAIAALLRKCPVLEDFRCSSTRVDSEGGFALAEALGTCPHLKKIDLCDNMFGVDAGIALRNVISGSTNLTEIYLSYLNLENKGTVALVNALKDSASSLEVLEMAGNDVTEEAAPALVALVLAKKEFIKKIGLADNKLKDEGAAAIALALENDLSRLTEVDLSTNMITKTGAKLLSYVVVKKPGFKLLNINGNFLSDETVDDVKYIFVKSPHLLGPLDENDPEGESS